MSKQYKVTANGQVFGEYQASSEQEARDLCAQDAGYKDEADMVAQLEQGSELEVNEMQCNAIQFKIKHCLSQDSITNLIQSYGGRLVSSAAAKVVFFDHTWGSVELDGSESVVEIPDSCGEPWLFEKGGDDSVFAESGGRVVSCEKIAEIENFDPAPARAEYEKRRDAYIGALSEEEKYL